MTVSRHRRARPVLAAMLLATIAPLACRSSSPPTTPVERPRDGGVDVTFFVAADTHIGYAGMMEANRRQITAMNDLPGRPYPPEIGGFVAAPAGVLIAGDLTESGLNEGEDRQWDGFVQLYGLTGKDGLLKSPVYEIAGNHDDRAFSPVLKGVKNRHGGLKYSWDWGDLHMVALGKYPDSAGCRWLRHDLAAIGVSRPVVLFFHYGIEGPWSNSWDADEKEAFGKAIAGYNVIGIFHGHWHASLHTTWLGYDVYNVGSPKMGNIEFAVVHVTDETMTVGSRRWDRGAWSWCHTKKINAAAGK